MKTYCTYFDSRYLTRGLAMCESLSKFESDFELYVLCLDDNAFRALETLRVPSVHPVALAELERADEALAATRSTRSTVEYYFTMTAAFVLHVLRKTPRAEFITYLDADLFFFGAIDPVFKELGDGSVGIIAHKFVPWMQHLAQYGLFNVGCVVFRNDDHGRRVLESWRSDCIAWCYDRLEGDRYADQKYLNKWPAAFAGVAVIEHKGANVAPWNVGQYTLTARDGEVLVDGERLLFYHFHRFRHWRGSAWRLGLAQYKTRPSHILREHVYRPYVEALERWADVLRTRNIAIASGTVRKTEPKQIIELIKAPLHLLTGELIFSRKVERVS